MKTKLTLDQFSVNQKVHYQPDHFKEYDKYENGIVKEVPKFASNTSRFVGHNCVRVVYYCDDDWDHYYNYTSTLTRIDDLKLGWR